MRIRYLAPLILVSTGLPSGPVRERNATASLPALSPVPSRSRPDTPYERSMRQAWSCRSRAHLAVARGLEALDAWDPQGMGREGDECWRQAQLARDRSGDLHRARIVAREAVSLARTPTETYRATVLLAWIEGDLGCHAAELRQARRLMALAPRDPRSQAELRRASMGSRPVVLVRRPKELP